MRMSMKKLMLIIACLLLSGNAHADLTSGETQSLDQSANQSQGNYQPMNMGYAGFNSLGMIQEAWQDPLQNLGEGQTKPAYSKYYWSPDLVLPIRVREGMITMINFPEWELIEQVKIGDARSFSGSVQQPNTVMLYPAPRAAVGVDTNVVVFGRSGNKYVFYVRSEGVNTERLTNAIIDIDVVGDNNTSGGSPRGNMGQVSGVGGTVGSGSDGTVYSSYTRRFLKEDWLKSIPMDPTKFRFDIEIYVPNPDDVIIAPERVWHDDIFTYIDLGEKALNMLQRPIVTMIIERSETPIGFRTKGPNNRLIIVEGVGDMVMRSGKRMVCLKMRRSDDEGLQYVTYADTSNEWDVGPKIPDNGNGAGAGAGGAGYGAGGAGMGAGGNQGGVYVPNGANDMTGGAAGVPMSGIVGGSMGGFAGNIDCSGMSQLSTNGAANIANPYPKYKYGSGFEGQSDDNISIELGTDGNVNNLENLWKDLSGRYSSVLNGYEPYYSVDAPADGQGKELFHLRVGPIKNLNTGDSVCSKLGRSGVFCSVVRMQ